MIRSAALEDLPVLTEIYRWYVEHTVQCLEEVAPTLEEMTEFFLKQANDYPWLVWEEEGILRGFAYASAFRGKFACRFTAEISFYLQKDCHRRGIGEGLVRAMISHLRQKGFYTLLFSICSENTALYKLCDKLGFIKAGHYKNVGYKFEKWLSFDHYLLPLSEYQIPATEKI